MTLLLLALPVGCAPMTQRVTVVTYNIHHGVGMDKKLDLERIANVIREARPDLVALQEVDLNTNRTNKVDQAAELGRLLGMKHAFGASMEFDGGKYGNAVLSRFPIASHKTVALPWQEGNKREPRSAIVATVSPPGRQMIFISTHLDHTEEPSDRFIQAKALDALRSDRQFSPGTILAGDFNCEPDSEPMKHLSANWFIVSNGDSSPTYPADNPTKKIDHVLVQPPPRWRVIEVRVMTEPVASDHRPVMVTMELLPQN